MLRLLQFHASASKAPAPAPAAPVGVAPVYAARQHRSAQDAFQAASSQLASFKDSLSLSAAPAPAAPRVDAAAADSAFQSALSMLSDVKKGLVEQAQALTARPAPPAERPAEAEALKQVSPEELARLGREDKRGFFAALRPAAEATEREFGVPAAITLAQAALETGWGKHIIPGFNIFGIKGKGPAGTVQKGTWEVYDGKSVTITAAFAKFHDFYEAVKHHGKLFHNGYYTKAMEQWKRDHDPFAFARNITGIYATDPAYADKLSSIMREYDLA